jgi:hypothetical protein
MVNKKTKGTLCISYSHRFLPMSSGLAVAGSALLSLSFLWCYCFGAAEVAYGVWRRRAARFRRLEEPSGIGGVALNAAIDEKTWMAKSGAAEMLEAAIGQFKI